MKCQLSLKCLLSAFLNIPQVFKALWFMNQKKFTRATTNQPPYMFHVNLQTTYPFVSLLMLIQILRRKTRKSGTKIFPYLCVFFFAWSFSFSLFVFMFVYLWIYPHVRKVNGKNMSEHHRKRVSLYDANKLYFFFPLFLVCFLERKRKKIRKRTEHTKKFYFSAKTFL